MRRKNSRGVSPIVSVILMVTLSIILASVVSGYAFDLIDEILETPAQATLQFSESYNPETEEYEVTVLWASSGTVESIYISRPDGTITEQATEVGEQIEVTGVEEGDELQVLGNMEDGSTQVVQTYSVGG